MLRGTTLQHILDLYARNPAVNDMRMTQPMLAFLSIPAQAAAMARPELIPPGGVPPCPGRGGGAGFVPHTGVSWPRSGHHLLVRLLQRALGPAFGYCQHYHTSAACCRRLPCVRDDIHLTKSHDFTGDLPQLRGQRYLVQHRAFLPSVISDFELVVRGGGEDSRTAFLRHASERFGAYRAFRARWIESTFASDQVVLRYEDLVAAPDEALGPVLASLAPGQRHDPARIARAIREVDGERIERGTVHHLRGAGVHDPRDPRRFRHHDPTLFALLARLSLTREEALTKIGAGAGGRVPDEAEIIRIQADGAHAGVAPLAPGGDP